MTVAARADTAAAPSNNALSEALVYGAAYEQADEPEYQRQRSDRGDG